MDCLLLREHRIYSANYRGLKLEEASTCDSPISVNYLSNAFGETAGRQEKALISEDDKNALRAHLLILTFGFLFD